MSGPVLIVSASDTLPLPPTSWAKVDRGVGVTIMSTEFDLEIWADAAATTSAMRLRGAIPKDFAIADDVVEGVDAGANTLNLSTHGYTNGDGPLEAEVAGGTIVGGLTVDTPYWVGVVDADNVRLYESLDAVLSGGTPVDITGGGTGTTTIVDVESGNKTKRLRWESMGLLGDAGDGAIVLANTSDGWSKKFSHRRGTLAYSITGTTDAALSAAMQFLS